MDLKLPITINDEVGDEVITATGMLDLASGEIRGIQYTDWDVAADGAPWEAEDYEFTSGILSHDGRDVEFGIQVNRVTGQYAVSASELLEIKAKAAALFSARR